VWWTCCAVGVDEVDSAVTLAVGSEGEGDGEHWVEPGDRHGWVFFLALCRARGG
jgi:hypothetical protein